MLSVRGTKTEASSATIPLLPALAAELRAYRERQAAESFARIRPQALVFQTINGKPIHRRNVLRAVQNAAGKAKLNGEDASLSAATTYATPARPWRSRSG